LGYKSEVVKSFCKKIHNFIDFFWCILYNDSNKK
jgi:hypothetical protein